MDMHPDPAVMDMSTELEAALILATAPGGTPVAAFEIAGQMVERGLQHGPPEQVVASCLLQLELQHRAQSPATPDPYRRLTQRLLDTGALARRHVETAYFAAVLITGQADGWLPADLYDKLLAHGGDDPLFQTAIASIERRPASRPDPPPSC